MPDGKEEITYLDGSVVTIDTNGDRVLLLPNGQKEIHTQEHKVKAIFEKFDGVFDFLFVCSGENIPMGPLKYCIQMVRKRRDIQTVELGLRIKKVNLLWIRLVDDKCNFCDDRFYYYFKCINM